MKSSIYQSVFSSDVLQRFHQTSDRFRERWRFLFSALMRINIKFITSSILKWNWNRYWTIPKTILNPRIKLMIYLIFCSPSFHKATLFMSRIYNISSPSILIVHKRLSRHYFYIGIDFGVHSTVKLEFLYSVTRDDTQFVK